MRFPLDKIYIFDHEFPLNRDKMTLGQNFGENYLDKYKEWGLLGHNGQDWPCRDGESVYAAHDGVVTKVIEETVGISGTRGKGISLKSKTKWPSGYLTTIYWHLKDFNVQAGQEVKEGDVIAWADNTGYSTGTHLHFGIKFVDENSVTINADNGYGGYVNPLPFFMTINEQELALLYKTVFGRDPDVDSFGYAGQSLAFVLGEFQKSPEWKAKAQVLQVLDSEFNVKL